MATKFYNEPKIYMERYPYLAVYNNLSPFEDVILLMIEAHCGRIVYIPPDLPRTDPRSELSFMEMLTPANIEIEDYSGAIVIRNNTDSKMIP